MTRFKELRRVEAAIEHKNEAELRWSLWYAQMRARIAPNKRHEKYWQDMKCKIQAALEVTEETD